MAARAGWPKLSIRHSGRGVARKADGADETNAGDERRFRHLHHPILKGTTLTHISGSILVTYCWIVAAVLIFFLFLIGRFYEIRFGQRSYYELFLIPLGLFVVAVVWDAFLANDDTGNALLDFVGAPGPDLLFLIGGIGLVILCYALHRTMMGGRG